jgi:poly(A) polymerase
LFTDTFLQAFDSVIRQLGVSAFLCGGTVRDLLLNRPFRDVDVVLSGRVFEAADLFHSKMKAPFFVLDQERQVARVVCPEGNWDFSGFRNHTIEGDLKKRDFTINAIAIRWEDFFPNRTIGAIVDPHYGLADLKTKRIRTVAEDSLRDDPLRMLRAYRIQAELGFEIGKEGLQQIEASHTLIQSVAGERIREELDRIFLQPDSAAAWGQLGQTSLFDSMFPELKPMKGCEQGGYHHLDAWSHSVLTLENFEKFIFRIPEVFPEQSGTIQEYLHTTPGTTNRIRLLKWATLFHDVGKPQTRELKEPGRWRFHGHDHSGSELAEAILKRLKFARKDILLVLSVIEHHLRPLNLYNVEERQEEHLYRFFRAVGQEAIGTLLISYADITAARGPLSDAARDAQFLKLLQELVAYYYNEYYPAISMPELIKGRDLMAKLQVKPGPMMGELLKEIREAQLRGTLSNRNQALDFASHWLKNKI